MNNHDKLIITTTTIGIPFFILIIIFLYTYFTDPLFTLKGDLF